MPSADFRLDPRDQEKYGGPEWVTFDRDQLDDTPYDELHRWETQLGTSVSHILIREFPRATALGLKGVVWLARQMAGVTEPGFANFNIRTQRVTSRATGGDANPPALGSSEPPSE